MTAAPALADSTSGNAYSSPAGQVQADVSSGTKTPSVTTSNEPTRTTQSVSGSQLPFTGLDVGLLLGAGGVLLLGGFALSRLTRPATQRPE
jgi:hypothetical protein